MKAEEAGKDVSDSEEPKEVKPPEVNARKPRDEKGPEGRPSHGGELPAAGHHCHPAGQSHRHRGLPEGEPLVVSIIVCAYLTLFSVKHVGA